MRTAGEVIGTISLYRLVPGPLAVSPGAPRVLADAVTAMLLQDPLAYKLFTGPRQEGGWSSRALVQQAAGMLMGRLEVSVGDALAILRSYAFAADIQLTDVARDVLDRKLDLSGY